MTRDNYSKQPKHSLFTFCVHFAIDYNTLCIVLCWNIISKPVFRFRIYVFFSSLLCVPLNEREMALSFMNPFLSSYWLAISNELAHFIVDHVPGTWILCYIVFIFIFIFRNKNVSRLTLNNDEKKILHTNAIIKRIKWFSWFRAKCI